MLGAINIVAFVPTRDSGKARSFYQGVLGLRFVKDDGFALVLDANGIMVRVAKAPEFKPAPFTILGWQVSGLRKWWLHSTTEAFTSRDSASWNKTSWGFGRLPVATRWLGSKILTAMFCRFRNTFDRCPKWFPLRSSAVRVR
jgi:catechol 2,3-dioxygenase-like lactoylglutathione lyase family enzyme